MIQVNILRGWGGTFSSEYIDIYISYVKNGKMHFLAATKINLLLPPKMAIFFVKVLIDFLTIRKYRKKDINKIV